MRRASQLSWIEDCYRRERAHRSWQAMQAVLAFAAAFAAGFVEGSPVFKRGDIDWAGVDMNGLLVEYD